MKIEVRKPNIVRIAYLPEPGAPHYSACTWAFFDFDVEEWLLNIQSDIGEYAHGWPAGKGETFLELCARMSDDYLEGKLFHENYTVFKKDATIENFREYFKECEFSKKRTERLLEDLHDKLDEYDLEDCVPLAEYLVDEWNNDHDLGIDCAWEYVEKDLTAWQKRIVQIFRDYVQPKLREIVKAQKGAANAGT